ncbi:MAG: hypothetical protein ABI700_07545 [Chloroflexota bacterium]
MDILRSLHSWVRWLVVLVALIDLVYFAIGWRHGRKYDHAPRRLMSAFSGAISLQWLLGVIFLIALGSQTGFGIRYYGEHLTVMTLAVFAANLPNILRRRELTDAQRYIINLGSIVAVIVLVFIGISLLPEAIRWRFFLP